MTQSAALTNPIRPDSGAVLDLVLARHGQSYGNLDRSLGQDTDLTDLGRQQAATLGDWLEGQGYRFSALYASPLRRARQTAEIVNAGLGLEVILDADLRETEVPYLERLPERAEPLGAEGPQPFSAEYEQMRTRLAHATARGWPGRRRASWPRTLPARCWWWPTGAR